MNCEHNCFVGKSEIVPCAVTEKSDPVFDEITAIVWIDDKREENNTASVVEQSKSRLYRFAPLFRSFADLDECVDFLSDSTPEDEILVLLPPSANDTLLTFLGECFSVKCVYVYSFPPNTMDCTFLLHRCKVKAVINDVFFLCKQLRGRRLPREEDRVRMSVVNDQDILSDDENKQHISHMCVLFFRDVVEQLVCSKEDMDDMLHYLREKVAGNTYDLAFVDTIEHEYHLHSPLWFYTQPKFLFAMINRALYLNDIEAMYEMRVLIKDIHNQLVELYESNSHIMSTVYDGAKFQLCEEKPENKVTLYRGRRMTIAEVQQLERNVGGLIMISNFLSTSTDEDVARMFAGDPDTEDPTTIPVVFQIEAHAVIGFLKSPFANLDTVSSLGTHEHEYLFTIGSVFRIQRTVMHPDGVWYIYLLFTADDDPQFISICNRMLDSFQRKKKDLNALGVLIMQMRNYELSEKVMLKAISTEKEIKRLPSMHGNLGHLYAEKNDVEKAQKHLHIAYELCEKRAIVNRDNQAQNELAQYSRTLGNLYAELGESPLALHYTNQAIEIELSKENSDFENLLGAYYVLGTVLQKENDLDGALFNYQLSLRLATEHLPLIHPKTERIHQVIGKLFAEKKLVDEAVFHLEKALEIAIACYPPDDPSVAMALYHRTYVWPLEHMSEGIEMCLRAYEIAKKSLGSSHSLTQMCFAQAERFRNLSTAHHLFGELNLLSND